MSKVFIIAELSANHNNDLSLAKRTIKAIAKTGADAIKIQTYKPQSLTIQSNTGYFAPRTEGLWKGYTPWDLYTEAAMPYEWQPELQALATSLGLEFFSSPFDLEGIDFLETLNVPKYKIASFEITDIPLIEYAASKGKPMIMSTGVAEIVDIERAIAACRRAGNDDITILKCTSNYPATLDEANLVTITDMQSRFGVKVGVSDHTMGHIVPMVAVSLGAVVVEKHFILDRSLKGPDSSFSMEPEEFKAMVDQVRAVELTLGETNYEVTDHNKARRRSIFVVEDVEAGEMLTEKNIRSIRPGVGMHPRYLKDMLGKKTKQRITAGTPLQKELLQD